ncbi:MAG: DUF4873 domain-containing protein [Nocardioidaceae bacterium]|nr:DUF4873 domain-containing protein [Nocardioidaceae bacterium]
MHEIHEEREEYAGPAAITGDVGELNVAVTLRGHFEPIDGKFHWYGRISADSRVEEQHRPGATVTLTTPYGAAAGRLSDQDPWGRFRITGTGTPPF